MDASIIKYDLKKNVNVIQKSNVKNKFRFFARANLNVKMTVRKWFKFGKSLQSSDVKMMFLILVTVFVLDNLPLTCKGEDYNRGKFILLQI